MTDVTPSAAHLRGAVDLSALVNRSAQDAARPMGGASPSGLIFDGTDADFAQFLDLSSTVPVIVDLWAEWCEPCKQLSPVLEKLVREYAGRFVLVRVDVDANPQLTQAFQAQSIPTVAAVIGGRPMALFQGALPEAQVRDVFEQVLQLAAQSGVTGTVAPGAEADGRNGNGQDVVGEVPSEPEPEPLPPLHQAAYDAIESGDFDTAITAYKTAIAQDPRDALAVAGLAQVSLLSRLQDKDPDALRAAAAADQSDVDAQFAVADLDLSGGHVEDAFVRLLDLFARLGAAERDPVRQRLLELFEVVGSDDPRVSAARARLAALLY
jgi:Thioredoxin domain-containing protein